MGQAGDVLRTTPLLGSLKKTYPHCYLTWLVAPSSSAMLVNNPYLDQIYEYQAERLPELLARRFDLLLNLDVTVESSALATLLRAKEKKGFGLNEEGVVYGFTPQAAEWLLMSFRDDLKKKNRTTYQKIISQIAETKDAGGNMTLILSSEEKKFSKTFIKKAGIRPSQVVIGFNTGAGNKWPLKKWTVDGFVTLVHKLAHIPQVKVILLGGPEERGRNEFIRKQAPGLVIDSGTDNSLRQFCALVNACDLVVTGDTMALHIALALGKKVVSLFGPTSPWEIELFGQGRKVISPLPCLCCYLTQCSREPSCMEAIKPEKVLRAVKQLLPK